MDVVDRLSVHRLVQWVIYEYLDFNRDFIEKKEESLVPASICFKSRKPRDYFQEYNGIFKTLAFNPTYLKFSKLSE